MAIDAVRKIFEGCAAFMQCFQKEPIAAPPVELLSSVVSNSLNFNYAEDRNNTGHTAILPSSSTADVGIKANDGKMESPRTLYDDVDPATCLRRLTVPPEHYRRRQLARCGSPIV